MDKREIRFDGWTVNFDSGEITRDGNTHRLQDQPLQILEELVSHPGEVVTREQLIARLWPKGVVEFDTGLNSAMRKLRIALGDDAETPRYIETLPRKGYRFIGRIEDDTPITGIPTLPAQYVPTSFETGAVIGRRASDRRAPHQANGAGVRQHPGRAGLGGGGLEHARQTFPGRCGGRSTADDRGAAAGRHERGPDPSSRCATD